jgi:hypothetical protein
VYIARSPDGWIPELGEQLWGLVWRVLKVFRRDRQDPRSGEGPGDAGPLPADHKLSESSRA